MEEALPVNSVILDGKYRLKQLVHQRPRVNLYLGQRLAAQDLSLRQAYAGGETLVAIRELVLTGLTGRVRQQIERAAYEEFLSPLAPVSPRLEGAADRAYTYAGRHYLVMHLQSAHAARRIQAVTLAELLRGQREWPSWLDMPTATSWGIQLCRIVARFHRLGSVLGDLDPAAILVDGSGTAQWVPVLLAAWPPALHFWPSLPGAAASEDYISRIFAPVTLAQNDPFAAPEIFSGAYDGRADVYSLGALLYLLFTHYAPPAAGMRGGKPQARLEQLGLIPPRRLNPALSMPHEGVLLHALELEPYRRYSTAFDLAEALEAIDVRC